MHETTIGISEQARRVLLADPIKYNLTATERAALVAYKTILQITGNEQIAKELFQSSWTKDPARADVKNIDEVLNKLTPENVSTKKDYYSKKANQSPIPGKLWYNTRSFFVGFRDHFRKEPRKPNVTKPTPKSWIDALAEKKVLGMSAARILSYLAFGLTVVGVVAACFVTGGLIAPFGALSVLGAASTLVGTAVGIVSGEASDKHDANKLIKDHRIMIRDAYTIHQAAKANSNSIVQQKAHENITSLLDRTMRHLQIEEIEGVVPTAAEKAMFGLKTVCAFTGLAGPIASGLHLFGSSVVSHGLSQVAQITSDVSSGVAALNNGTNLLYKQAKHESDIENEEGFKCRISSNNAANAMMLGQELNLHKKTLRWCDKHPSKQGTTFTSRTLEPTARTI